MDKERANPDEPLEAIRKETKVRNRGKLKIFFGYAAGVGKTYSMLEAAKTQAASGVDIVLGYVEPHARPETEALTLGMHHLAPRIVEYRGIKVKEFDLDAALARKPAVLVVDELAHTNAPGSRHAKRWQDVEELLDACINVYTTLNVQHVESLNDIVAQVSGIQVRETISDTVLDQADSIELVDLPPEELLQRFQGGKVYVPAQAERAMQKFFRLPNLIALRELSLRRTADRVNAQAQVARQAEPGTQVWATSERLLVCVGPSPTSARVIRIAKRMAAALRAPWTAVYVDTGGVMSDATREKLTRNLNLAEQLGAQTTTLAAMESFGATGPDVADEIVKYAHARNFTKIIIGKTGESRWRELLGKSIVNEVLHRSGDIDVYVIRGKEDPSETATAGPPRFSIASRRIEYGRYAWAILVTALCTLIAWLMHNLGLSETSQVMVYFLGVAYAAARQGRGPGILASVLGVLAFDFFFVPPQFSFAVNDPQYSITFAVMLTISILISTLAHRIRRQAETSRQRERRTEVLYRFSRKLAGTAGTHQLVTAAEAQLSESFASEVAIFLPDESGRRLHATRGGPASFAADERELGVAQWVFGHGQLAGRGTDTLPEAHALYLPLTGSQGPVGVLALRPIELGRFNAPDQRQLLETLARQIALVIERDGLAEQAQKVLVQVEAERLRSSLLSSVSHDLRTPLAVIAGAGSTLLEGGNSLSEPGRQELTQTIVEESNRLALLVDNLLHITRIESGAVAVNKQWYPLEEVIGSALERVKKQLADRKIDTYLVADLPMVKFDGVLVEQVLINLLENAARYAPAGSSIEIFARMEDSAFRPSEGSGRADPVEPWQAQGGAPLPNIEAVIEVADRGPGLTDEERQRVFDKFYRGRAAGKGQRGAGLGLAICRAVVEVHGGRIWEENRPEGGARFIFTIPQEGQPPQVDAGIEPLAEG
jgi:two-component system sensor histidine kinase KdpD